MAASNRGANSKKKEEQATMPTSNPHRRSNRRERRRPVGSIGGGNSSSNFSCASSVSSMSTSRSHLSSVHYHYHAPSNSSSSVSGNSNNNSNNGSNANTSSRRNRGYVGAMILGLCILNIFDVDIYINQRGPSSGGNGRRSLLSTLYLSGPSTLMPWAQHHLVDVMDRPDPESETALFWHIPKSGGTTAKRLYQCMGQTLAHRVGADPRFGHDQEKEIVVFQPHGHKDWKVVNVDTTIKAGIMRAKRLGLVQSHTTDLIFTMEPNFAGQELYDEENKGRFLALFRHPVDRALSMFFYLQTATWERTYRPEWANMTVLEWANLPNAEEDYMVHKLVGKPFGEKVDETDLIIAKELVRQRFIVGLMNEMNESIRRFNIVLGVDEESERSHQCMEEFGLVIEKEEDDENTTEGADDGEVVDDEHRVLKAQRARATDKKNSNKHPKFEEGTPEYDKIASRNPMDVLLYKYVETLFDAQKEILDSYLKDETDSEVPQEDPQAVDESNELALLPPGTAMKAITNPKEIQGNLADITSSVGDRSSETPFFWHVPKSGGTTLQRLYWCMGSTIANEVGVNPKFGVKHGELDPFVAFSPWKDNPGKVVNVNVCSHDGILEAKNRGFLTKPGQPRVDFVSTSEFQFASMMLFSPDHKARMFALFRHPIDRAVSKFYYLQKATWEPTYNKRWASMTLEEWGSRDRGDNNWMVRNLIGKSTREVLNNDDLELAKEIVRTKFVVGLMDKFEESVHRFNILLGVDESDPKNQQCIQDFSSNQGDSHQNRNKEQIIRKNQFNSYSHPEAERGSVVWISLSKIHMYDVMLYKYIGELFKEQREMFQQEFRNIPQGSLTSS